MAGTTFCDVSELCNILNQYTRLSRLPKLNYLCLIGKSPVGSDCHIGSTRFKQIHCVDKHNLFLRFSLTIQSKLPFIKSGQMVVLFPQMLELESLRPYKVELLPGQLYLGDYKQAISPHVLKDLKLSALVNVSEDTSHVCWEKETTPSVTLIFERICVFIGSRLNTGSAVEIFSSHRISRCSAAAMAFLLHHLKYTLGEAWELLSDWELHTLGRRMTDIAVPCY
uniref:Serine/threonine/tyrosine interacting-like 1 n=1 Tax=Oncorhynchus mykiss TaxID=8022 RepID=A0A8C7PYB3_ONCMY